MLNRQMRFSLPSIKVRGFLPACDYCRARGNQIKSLSTVRQHSRKLGGAAEHWIDGSEKRICRLSFEILESA